MVRATALVRHALLVTVALAMAACGGGGGGSNNASPPPPATYTVGGTVSGLTGSGLILTMVAIDGSNNTQSTQTVTVPAGANTFTFPTGFAVTASPQNYTLYNVLVTAQPADSTASQNQTCIALNAFGFIHTAGNVTNVQVTCIANTASPLQGVYQLYQYGTATSRWIAFSQDGRYLFGTVLNDTTCPNNGNGVDYGAYNWNATTGSLQFLSALVYSMAPCGITNASGVVDSANRVMTRTGSGGSTVLTLVTNGNVANAFTLVPVVSTPSSVVGAFATINNMDVGINIQLANGHYVNMFPQTDAFSGATPGIEYGCYTATNGTFNVDTTSNCAGAVETAGFAGYSSGTQSTSSFKYSLPDANTFTQSFANYTFIGSRFDPNAATTKVVSTGYTVGGSVTGLSATGSPLTVQLLAIDGSNNTESIQTISVPAGATSFTFPAGIALATARKFNNFYQVQIAGQPAEPAQTCVATNAYGEISAANDITNVQISCLANPPSALQGLYRLSLDSAGTMLQTKWLAFSADGTYILGDIQNTTTCSENGNGVDYGTYNWNPQTGALTIQSAAIYSMAPCGFTNANGVVDSTTTFNLSRSGSGSATVLTLVGTKSGVSSTSYLLPVPTASGSGSIVGAFTAGTGLDQGLIAFGNDGHYLILNPQNDTMTGSGYVAGLEYGCYTYASATGVVTFDTSATCSGAVETAGGAGFSGGTATSGAFNTAMPFSNELQIVFGTYTFPFALFLPN